MTIASLPFLWQPRALSSRARHLPLLPGEETVLSEILETLREARRDRWLVAMGW